jgi:hypothetical protein
VAELWNGVGPQKLDMDELPVVNQPSAGMPRQFMNFKFLALAFAVALVVLLMTWLLVRHARAADRRRDQAPTLNPNRKEEQGPVAARISFACAACGTKLKATAALAGKRVKCSHCAQAVVVPAIQAEESE